MKAGTWILGLVQPLIAKILITLGFSIVTITGVQAALQGLKTQLTDSVNGLPAAMLQLFLLGGGGVGLGIIFGAMTTVVLIWSIQSATKIVGVAAS